jgi:hypothetical protein
MTKLPEQVTALVFRSSVVGGDPDHVVAIDGVPGRVNTGWAKESGVCQIETLKKPKYIASLESKGYEFGLTQSCDIGAWLNGSPCSRLDEFSWRWTSDERLYLTVCFWGEIDEDV